MSKIYCMASGEMENREDHTYCVCNECAFGMCGMPLNGRGVSLEFVTNTYVHARCVIPYLRDNEELKTRAELMEENV